MTANKIYTLHAKATKVPFKYWIETENLLYEHSNTTLPFLNWLNKKYQLNGKSAWVNADGELKHKDVVESLADYINEEYNTGVDKGEAEAKAEYEKKIAILKAKQKDRIIRIGRKVLIASVGAYAFWYFLKSDKKKK